MRPHIEEWLGVMVHTFHPTFVGDTNRRTAIEPGPGMKQDHTSKIISAKRLSRVAQVVKCLPSMHKALSSTSTMAKRKKKEVLDQIALSCHSAKERHIRRPIPNSGILILDFPIFITIRHKFLFIINY
jgi:hypothetical protein